MSCEICERVCDSDVGEETATRGPVGRWRDGRETEAGTAAEEDYSLAILGYAIIETIHDLVSNAVA